MNEFEILLTHFFTVKNVENLAARLDHNAVLELLAVM